MRTRSLVGAVPVAVALAASPAHADERVQATLTVETDVSANRDGNTSSLAPDLAVGVHHDLAFALIHSTYGRTGFRGAAGGGLCTGDGCAATYDTAGVEALYALTPGILIDPGLYATSFDEGFYVAKLGAKLHTRGRVMWAVLPSVSLALTHRGAVPDNPDRAWLPFEVRVGVTRRVVLGVMTGAKTTFDDPEGTYEVAAGALAEVAVTRDMAIGASWVHGKLLAGNVARPDDMSGIDSRALQIWLTARR
jgi:hypothetical protein